MEVSANPADYPVCGGYADVFRCTGQDQDVAVKMLRTGPKSDLGKVARVSYCRPSFLLYPLTRSP